MPDIVTAKTEAPKLTERQVAIQAFYDAKDKAEKAAAVEKYPILKTIFSVGEYT